ncbi:hypothetical protein NMY22_g12175 [Coprinellus aureogranulatus]|nr:hypothetical protein NMY22_g12175 [Coprinellus aureogranulatus]
MKITLGVGGVVERRADQQRVWLGDWNRSRDFWSVCLLTRDPLLYGTITSGFQDKSVRTSRIRRGAWAWGEDVPRGEIRGGDNSRYAIMEIIEGVRFEMSADCADPDVRDVARRTETVPSTRASRVGSWETVGRAPLQSGLIRSAHAHSVEPNPTSGTPVGGSLHRLSSASSTFVAIQGRRPSTLAFTVMSAPTAAIDYAAFSGPNGDVVEWGHYRSYLLNRDDYLGFPSIADELEFKKDPVTSSADKLFFKDEDDPILSRTGAILTVVATVEPDRPWLLTEGNYKPEYDSPAFHDAKLQMTLESLSAPARSLNTTSKWGMQTLKSMQAKVAKTNSHLYMVIDNDGEECLRVGTPIFKKRTVPLNVANPGADSTLSYPMAPQFADKLKTAAFSYEVTDKLIFNADGSRIPPAILHSSLEPQGCPQKRHLLRTFRAGPRVAPTRGHS